MGLDLLIEIAPAPREKPQPVHVSPCSGSTRMIAPIAQPSAASARDLTPAASCPSL
jgi:hypothetical protein